MQTNKKFFITTSIAYVNGAPHVGFAMEQIQGDALARWHRLIGDEVFFLTGTDENSLKLLKAAETAGVTPQELADQNAQRFIELTTTLNLSHDDFIRTTDTERHFPGAQKMWQALTEAGYIYKGTYDGLYCIDCERFYTSKELVDGLCSIHHTKPEARSEENYLFKLSAFTDQLKEIITKDEYRVVPEARHNEITAVLSEGLHDISFSRPADKLAMGVPVPGDDTQRMYVWCDALVNYISGVGYGRDQNLFEKWWPAQVHLIGKDILRFHAAIWPAMLLAAKLPLPKMLYAHGHITVEGAKMSKSQGNVVDPFGLVEAHGLDPVRYYLLSLMPYADDGDFSDQRFTEIYTAELANDLGNLVSRVLAMVAKNYDGVVPEGTADIELKEHVGQTHHGVRDRLDICDFSGALTKLHQLVVAANRYVDQREPYKQTGRDQADTLYTLVQVLGHLALLYGPVMPATGEKLQQRLALITQTWDWDSLLEWEKVPVGTTVNKGEALFPK